MNVTELEKCIVLYGKDIFAFCRQMAYSQQDAEELYQDTFLKAMELLDQIETAQNPKSYLLSITVRLWKNRKRKYARRNRIAQMQSLTQEEGQSEPDSGCSLEEEVMRKEWQREVRKAVHGLDEKYRIAVYLYYMEGLSIEEVASVMKLPKGTIKSRLHQARKLLKVQLGLLAGMEDYYG